MRSPSPFSHADAASAHFYEAGAAHFMSKRARPWRAWDVYLAHLRAHSAAPLNVLDLGAGHGRFGASLRQSQVAVARYVAVDRSQALLRVAAAAGAETHACDLRDWHAGEERFDAVVAQGVLHHIPGESERIRLLSQLLRAVAPGGSAFVSFWTPRGLRPLLARALPLDVPPAHLAVHPDAPPAAQPRGHLAHSGHAASSAITPEQPGDYLLPFGEPERAYQRYVHLFSDAAIERTCRLAMPRALKATHFSGVFGEASNHFTIFDSVRTEDAR